MLEPILELIGLADKPKKKKFRWKIVQGNRIVSKHFKKSSAEKAKKKGQKVLPINAVVRYKKKAVKKIKKFRKRVSKRYRK